MNFNRIEADNGKHIFKTGLDCFDTSIFRKDLDKKVISGISSFGSKIKAALTIFDLKSKNLIATQQRTKLISTADLFRKPPLVHLSLLFSSVFKIPTAVFTSSLNGLCGKFIASIYFALWSIMESRILISCVSDHYENRLRFVIDEAGRGTSTASRFNGKNI